MLYDFVLFLYAEFAIRHHGEDAVIQSIETFEFKVEDQLSGSQTSSKTQRGLNGKKSMSETNCKRGRRPKYKKSETMGLDFRKKIFLMQLKELLC